MKKLSILLACAICAVKSLAGDWNSVALKHSVTGVQPMTGLVLWTDNAKNRFTAYGASHALEYSYVAPCKVVTGCADDGTIQYDWSYLENLLNDIKSRNHQAVLRFFYVYPGEKMVDDNKGTTAVPAYIKALPDYHETYKNVKGDGETWYADWSNSELKRFTKHFYTDFAARYGSDPRIAFIEVGFGHWAEYHIYDSNGTDIQFGKNFPTKEYQKEFFMHLKEVMPIPWAISIDAASDEYTPFTNDSELQALQFGLFDDSFMHQNHEIGSKDGYNEECWNAMGKDRWQTGVCGGEISYYKSSDQKNFTNPAGMYGHTWEEMARKYHISFMIANDNPGGKNSWNNPTRFKECSMAAGYHFVVTDCETDGVQTRLTVKNTGVAPLYRDAFFAIGSVRSETSMKGLLPGESIDVVIPSSLHVDKNGTVDNAPEIVCDFILDTQRIEYECDITTEIGGVVDNSCNNIRGKFSLDGKVAAPGIHGIIVSKGKKVATK